MGVQSVFLLNVSDQWRKQFDLLLFVVCFYFLYCELRNQTDLPGFSNR